MRNKLVRFLFILLTLCSFSLSAFAAYYFDDGANEDNPNVDKFRSQHGLKIKTSALADKMENATREAMDRRDGIQSQEVKQVKKRPKASSRGQNGRSYKWF